MWRVEKKGGGRREKNKLPYKLMLHPSLVTRKSAPLSFLDLPLLDMLCYLGPRTLKIKKLMLELCWLIQNRVFSN
jgi:hypothetical protein